MADPAGAKPAEPLPGTPEYDAAMAKLADDRAAQAAAAANGDQTPAPAAKPEKPAHVPDKFWNAETGQIDTEGLLKSYSELEGKLGGVKPPEAPKAPDEAAQKEAEDKAKAAGVDFEALAAEYVTEGGLKPETYQALEAKGFSKEVVDAYIEGQKAINEKVQQAGYSLVGGQDQYTNMVEWARTTLTPAEKVAFNNAVTGKDASARELAILGLHAKYTKANGTDPSVTIGGSQSGAGARGFRSNAEMISAINDPRYAKDAAYRREVDAKIGAM